MTGSDAVACMDNGFTKMHYAVNVRLWQMPEPGEFELVVDSMEALEELIRRFDPEAVESSPQQASPAARAGKRQAVRLVCWPVAFLHSVCCC